MLDNINRVVIDGLSTEATAHYKSKYCGVVSADLSKELINYKSGTILNPRIRNRAVMHTGENFTVDTLSTEMGDVTEIKTDKIYAINTLGNYVKSLGLHGAYSIVIAYPFNDETGELRPYVFKTDYDVQDIIDNADKIIAAYPERYVHDDTSDEYRLLIGDLFLKGTEEEQSWFTEGKFAEMDEICIVRNDDGSWGEALESLRMTQRPELRVDADRYEVAAMRDYPDAKVAGFDVYRCDRFTIEEVEQPNNNGNFNNVKGVFRCLDPSFNDAAEYTTFNEFADCLTNYSYGRELYDNIAIKNVTRKYVPNMDDGVKLPPSCVEFDIVNTIPERYTTASIRWKYPDGTLATFDCGLEYDAETGNIVGGHEISPESQHVTFWLGGVASGVLEIAFAIINGYYEIYTIDVSDENSFAISVYKCETDTDFPTNGRNLVLKRENPDIPKYSGSMTMKLNNEHIQFVYCNGDNDEFPVNIVTKVDGIIVPTFSRKTTRTYIGDVYIVEIGNTTYTGTHTVEFSIERMCEEHLVFDYTPQNLPVLTRSQMCELTRDGNTNIPPSTVIYAATGKEFEYVETTTWKSFESGGFGKYKLK